MYCLQSVLVTVDRHEWYAPPQIYSRDDSTGLWSIRTAFQPLSPLPHSSVLDGDLVPAKQAGCTAEVTMEQVDQERRQELIDGVASMETNDGHSSEGSHAQDESDIGKKKRRVEEDLSADGAASDYSLLDNRELELKDTRNGDSTVVTDYQSPLALSANASYAEHAIEPTLVMFEVSNFKKCYWHYFPSLLINRSPYCDL